MSSSSSQPPLPGRSVSGSMKPRSVSRGIGDPISSCRRRSLSAVARTGADIVTVPTHGHEVALNSTPVQRQDLSVGDPMRSHGSGCTSVACVAHRSFHAALHKHDRNARTSSLQQQPPGICTNNLALAESGSQKLVASVSNRPPRVTRSTPFIATDRTAENSPAIVEHPAVTSDANETKNGGQRRGKRLASSSSAFKVTSVSPCPDGHRRKPAARFCNSANPAQNSDEAQPACSTGVDDLSVLEGAARISDGGLSSKSVYHDSRSFGRCASPPRAAISAASADESESFVVTLRLAADDPSNLLEAPPSLPERAHAPTTAVVTKSDIIVTDPDLSGRYPKTACPSSSVGTWEERSLPSVHALLHRSTRANTAVFVEAAMQLEAARREAELQYNTVSLEPALEQWPERIPPPQTLPEREPDKDGSELECSLVSLQNQLHQKRRSLMDQQRDIDEQDRALQGTQRALQIEATTIQHSAQSLGLDLHELPQETCSLEPRSPTVLADEGFTESFDEQVDAEQIPSVISTRGLGPAGGLEFEQPLVEWQRQLELENRKLSEGRRELGERWHSLQKRQLEVQREREDIAYHRHELDERLRCVAQQQEELERERTNFVSKSAVLSERWHSLRSHQLELEQERSGVEGQKQELGDRWESLKRHRLEHEEEMERLVCERQALDDWMEAEGGELNARRAGIEAEARDLNEDRLALDEARQAVDQDLNAIALRLNDIEQREETTKRWRAKLAAEQREFDKEMAAREKEVLDERRNLQELLEQVVDRQCEQSDVRCARPPAYWSNDGQRQIRVPWSDGALAIMHLMTRSVVHPCCSGRDGTFEIGRVARLNVWRVENLVLWKQYCNKAEEMGAVHAHRHIRVKPLVPPVPTHDDARLPECLRWGRSFNGALNEVLVWHGTRAENVDVIAKAGMDERVCQLDGMFGAGLYFAQEACKSGQYATMDKHGSRWFFLCRVLLGNPHYTSTAMRQTRRAPDKFNSVVFEPTGFGVGQHRELIVYDRHQVYPEYIVEACTS